MGRSESPGGLHCSEGAFPCDRLEILDIGPEIPEQICRLFLYYQDTSAALGFFQQHVDRFTALSQSWGIGNDTFEFWAWLARQ